MYPRPKLIEACFLHFLSQIIFILRVIPQSYIRCESVEAHLVIASKHYESVPNIPNVTFNIHGSMHHNNILIYIQQDATLHTLF